MHHIASICHELCYICDLSPLPGKVVSQFLGDPWTQNEFLQSVEHMYALPVFPLKNAPRAATTDLPHIYLGMIALLFLLDSPKRLYNM